MICPTCPAQPLALFICDDGVHRCYACKARRTPAPTSDHTAILHAKVALRNAIAKIEAVSGWDKSAFNCGKHEGLSEALGILKGGAQ